ncbi:uncharacterized protein LOC111004974 [Momordica charantia]|uniref:Uncharacterized protein LOC111004974 n=1 Tax=Momordica charantia TaxID=3673 RepID=A0A6J1BR88_MOMCH|nr:uncharacterized protein LOC111004974 [Momordica charantia]
MLVEKVGAGNDSFVNAKDDYGFTVLHLAVSNKQLQTVEYLVNRIGIKVNALTANGLTALDILTQSHRDLKDMDIAAALTSAGATTTISKPSSSSSSSSSHSHAKPHLLSRLIAFIFDNRNDESWLMRKQEAIMVVATLIATMGFQAGVNPPGGVWQEDNPAMNQTAGTSILAAKHLQSYNRFLGFNTAGFTASMLVILMLVTGMPSKHMIFTRILIVAMWIAVISMAYTYGYSIKFFTPEASDSIIYRISIFVSLVATASLGLFFLGKIFFILSHLEGKGNAVNSRRPTVNEIEVP